MSRLISARWRHDSHCSPLDFLLDRSQQSLQRRKHHQREKGCHHQTEDDDFRHGLPPLVRISDIGHAHIRPVIGTPATNGSKPNTVVTAVSGFGCKRVDSTAEFTPSRRPSFAIFFFGSNSPLFGSHFESDYFPYICKPAADEFRGGYLRG